MAFKLPASSALLSVLLIALSLPVAAETTLSGVEISLLADDSITSINANDSDDSAADNTDTESNAAGTVITYQDDLEGTGSTAEGLWRRIQDGYGMPNLESPYTAKHENWYASKPDYVKRMLERSQRYLFHIVQEVEKRGMPTEIALLPMVESGFNPQAVSTSRAVGLWQFMPATGKDFGLTQNWWADNRRDVTAATNAALNYLQKLHGLFGSWDLALAAYNAGEGTVQRAIDSNRRNGLPTDYQSLALSDETKNYVPKLQAIKNIMTSPEKYGLTIQPIADQPYFVKVNAPAQIDAKLAAKLAEISYDEFTALNPEYNRPVLKGASDHNILLPISAAETFKTNLANNSKPLVTWDSYHAKRGERIDKIAKKFGVSAAQLRSANNLPNTKKMSSAKQLIIPSGTSAQPDELSNHHDSKIAKNSRHAKQLEHIVKRKETLNTIAKQYGVTVKYIKETNKLRSNLLKKGQKLLINANVGEPHEA